MKKNISNPMKAAVLICDAFGVEAGQCHKIEIAIEKGKADIIFHMLVLTDDVEPLVRALKAE